MFYLKKSVNHDKSNSLQNSEKCPKDQNSARKSKRYHKVPKRPQKAQNCDITHFLNKTALNFEMFYPRQNFFTQTLFACLYVFTSLIQCTMYLTLHSLKLCSAKIDLKHCAVSRLCSVQCPDPRQLLAAAASWTGVVTCNWEFGTVWHRQ